MMYALPLLHCFVSVNNKLIQHGYDHFGLIRPRRCIEEAPTNFVLTINASEGEACSDRKVSSRVFNRLIGTKLLFSGVNGQTNVNDSCQRLFNGSTWFDQPEMTTSIGSTHRVY